MLNRMFQNKHAVVKCHSTKHDAYHTVRLITITETVRVQLHCYVCTLGIETYPFELLVEPPQAQRSG